MPMITHRKSVYNLLCYTLLATACGCSYLTIEDFQKWQAQHKVEHEEETNNSSKKATKINIEFDRENDAILSLANALYCKNSDIITAAAVLRDCEAGECKPENAEDAIISLLKHKELYGLIHLRPQTDIAAQEQMYGQRVAKIFSLLSRAHLWSSVITVSVPTSSKISEQASQLMTNEMLNYLRQNAPSIRRAQKIYSKTLRCDLKTKKLLQTLMADKENLPIKPEPQRDQPHIVMLVIVMDC